MPESTETTKISVWDDDEGGHYAEGHHESYAFISAVQRYVDECGVRHVLERDGITYEVADVEHGWFTQDPNDEERMNRASAISPGAFAVTMVRPRG